ncbi:carbonic anhydrase [Dermatophilaceae bacterium Soc4.6]
MSITSEPFGDDLDHVDDFDDVLTANAAFSADFRLTGFDGIARAGIGMLTCMDSRIDPLGMIGLEPGDAKIIRNPGARLTPNALEAMVLGVNLLQVRRILVVPHTRCAVASSTAAEISARVASAAGVDDPGMEFHVVQDQVAALRDDVRALAEHPLIAGQALVAGFVYDVDTGLLERRA